MTPYQKNKEDQKNKLLMNMLIFIVGTIAFLRLLKL